MPFLITTVLDDGSEKDAILNLHLCFAFAKDSEGHSVAISNGGARIVLGMSFDELKETVSELNEIELGEPEEMGAGINVELKP